MEREERQTLKSDGHIRPTSSMKNLYTAFALAFLAGLLVSVMHQLAFPFGGVDPLFFNKKSSSLFMFGFLAVFFLSFPIIRLVKKSGKMKSAEMQKIINSIFILLSCTISWVVASLLDSSAFFILKLELFLILCPIIFIVFLFGKETYEFMYPANRMTNATFPMTKIKGKDEKKFSELFEKIYKAEQEKFLQEQELEYA